MYQIPANCPYSLKGIKTFRGMEGMGFNATVYRDGKKVGFAIDDANGGPLMLQEFSKADSDALDAYGKSLPPYPAEPARGLTEPTPMDGDLLIEELLNVVEEQKLREKNRKRYEKFCKTEVLFRLKSEKQEKRERNKRNREYERIQEKRDHNAFADGRRVADTINLNDRLSERE
jgi:hypothetical protein